MKSINQDLRDRILRQELALRRKSDALVRRMDLLLRETEREINRRIELRLDWIAKRGYDSSDFTLQRLEVNLKEVQALIEAAYVKLGRELRDDMRQVANEQSQLASTAVKAAFLEVGLEFTVGLAEADLLTAIVDSNPFQGGLLREWTKSMSRHTVEAVRGVVRRGMLQGDSIRDMTREITKSMVLRRREAEAVVRTAVSHVANTARDLSWEANDDLITGIQWVSTLDNRTTPLCRRRDGKVYNMDHTPRGHNVPWLAGPGRLHWRCRSTSVPILKSWKELGIDAKETTGDIRAAVNGFVPATQTYYEWQRAQAK